MAASQNHGPWGDVEGRACRWLILKIMDHVCVYGGEGGGGCL